jgi:hypothetical protein
LRLITERGDQHPSLVHEYNQNFVSLSLLDATQTGRQPLEYQRARFRASMNQNQFG